MPPLKSVSVAPGATMLTAILRGPSYLCHIFRPNVKAIIIGCADMRVDPVHVLGINLGEAVVIRNIGD